MTAEDVSTPISRRTLVRVAAVVWLSFGVVQCTQSFISAQAASRDWQLDRALINGMPWWISWFLLTPLMAHLGARYPLTGGAQARSLTRLVLAGVMVCSVQLATVGTVYWFTTGNALGVAPSLQNQIQRFFGSFFLESLLTYAAAVGALVAVDFARAVRDERVTRARVEVEATRAQLTALTMELNPHFLFNTMSAISGLVAQGRANDAREVIRRLSNLLRKTLDCSNGQLSTVENEVRLVEDYLYIQRVRFSDRLAVGLTVDDRARRCLIPTMLLQPLVENAIRHGVELTEGRGDVRIDVARENGSLRIAIADTGGGFQLTATGSVEREGVGISNTRKRLEHMYESAASLQLRNRAEGGAEAIVTIPAVDR